MQWIFCFFKRIKRYKMIRLLLISVTFILLKCGTNAPFATQKPSSNAPSLLTNSKKHLYQGVNFVASPEKFDPNPMPAAQAVGINYLAVIPYGFSKVGQAKVHYNQHGQWWGETPEGVQKTIELAHAAGIDILLKPQIYVPSSWTGAIDFDKEADWAAWENSYEAYIMPFVAIADSMKVGAFCIGTEFSASTQKRTAFWEQLIKKIRKVYRGKLTYAANWNEFQHVGFWKDLDFMGIDAYFPLTEAVTPSVEDIKKAWAAPCAEIEKIQSIVQKPVVFTEFGYLSVDGCAWKAWEIEPKVTSTPINQQAQANAVQGLFEFWAEKPYWQGGFIWKWFPNMLGHEGYPDRDYTPQGKLAEKVLENWYK
jgi:hypothetical protein